jgi:molybdopterin synthase sulfur carrier subunit
VPDVLVRYYAAARSAAGVTEERATAVTVAALRAELTARHTARFATVLAACSLLVDGQAVRDDATALADGVTVEVLPPFAGG